MRLAFTTGLFPVVSETPFLNQITGLVQRGAEVDVYADRAQRGVPFHPDVERFGLVERTRYLEPIEGPPAARWRKAAAMVGRHRGAERRMLIRSLDPFRFWRRAWSLEQLVRTAQFLPRREYDICCCPFAEDALRTMRVRNVGALGGRLVVAFRGADTTRVVQRRGRHTYAEVFRKGSLFLPVSEEFARRIARLGCPEERIVVHRTGISLERFPYRDRCPPADGVLRLVSVGRLIEKKGIDFGLLALRQLLDEGVAAEYHVIGGGPLQTALEARVAELRLGAAVVLHGWKVQSDVRDLLDRSHVLLAPSVTASNGDEEGIPNVLKEAMAMGLPVVSTFHSGIPELVDDGVSGWLVPERDAAALADRIRRLAAQPERWRAMGLAGRARIERDYDIEKLNDRLLEMFERLIRTPEPS